MSPTLLGSGARSQRSGYCPLRRAALVSGTSSPTIRDVFPPSLLCRRYSVFEKSGFRYRGDSHSRKAFEESEGLRRPLDLRKSDPVDRTVGPFVSGSRLRLETPALPRERSRAPSGSYSLGLLTSFWFSVVGRSQDSGWPEAVTGVVAGHHTDDDALGGPLRLRDPDDSFDGAPRTVRPQTPGGGRHRGCVYRVVPWTPSVS